MPVAFNGFFDRRSLSSIRIKISERHSGRADCLEGEAKRTSVRERRLKGKMPPRMPRSVRTSHTRKARSSERACKRKTGTVSRACRHSNWRRSGDSNPRYPCGVYSLSRRAPSASRSKTRCACLHFAIPYCRDRCGCHACMHAFARVRQIVHMPKCHDRCPSERRRLA